MTKSSLVTICLFMGLNSFSQILNFEWVGTVESPSIAACEAMTIDKYENVISVGWYQNTQDFDPGPGTFNMTSNFENIFMQKLDASGNLVWAKQLVGSGQNQAHAVLCDTSANIFLCGNLNVPADMDPGAGTSTLAPFSGNQTFIAKYDPNGELLWARILPGNAFYSARRKLMTTADGSVLITGTFGGTQDFDPGPGTYNLSSAGTTSSYIVKLDETGNFMWARAFTGGNSAAYGIGLYPNGDLLINGHFNGTIDFDPGAGTANASSAGAFFVGYAVKLDNSGNYLWSKTFPATDDVYMYALGVNNLGEAFILGEFEGIVDLDPGAATDARTSNGGRDGLMVALDNAGNYLWGHTFGGNFDEKCVFVSTDNSGNWYTTGTFEGNVDMQPGSGTYSLSSTTYDMFACKYNSSGDIQWITQIQGTSNSDLANGIYRSSSGNVYLAGIYDDNIDFDPGPGSAAHSSFLGQDIFALKFSECTPGPPVPVLANLPDVTVDCSYSPASAPEATDACYGTIVGTPDVGFPITTIGTTQITWTYDAGGGNSSTQTQNITITDNSAPVPNVANLPTLSFVCSTNSLTAPSATDNCQGTIVGTHNASFPILSNTTVTWTYNDGNGNTTTQAQIVTIALIDNGISQQNAITLAANASGYTYQWVDCNNGNAIIPGATNQTFVASANGSYAVQISNGTCTELSDCITVNQIGLPENAFTAGISLLPNPTDGKLEMNFNAFCSKIDIVVWNTLGQSLATHTFQDCDHLAFELPMHPGTYIIEVRADAHPHARFKVVRR